MMVTITVILVLVSSFVAFDAPVPTALIDCGNPGATIDGIAQWLPPHYATFTDLMATEAGSPASSAVVLIPCPDLAWDDDSVLVLTR